MPHELSPNILFVIIALAGFMILLTIAALSDIATMTIPNWISVALVCLFPVAAIAAGLHWTQLAVHFAIAGIIFAAGFAMFAFNIVGGGDVKVFTAASLWTGAAALGDFAIATALAGGLLAFLMLAMRKTAKPNDTRPAFLNRLLDPARGIPYGVAIAAGAIFTLLQHPLALSLRI
jgi:prepilin peptidase CpaA